jgi:hypothetical protein
MSTLKVNAIQNTSGVTKYLAQAWVNFNGTGTVAINGQGNVSSITDNGVGDYTINFTTAMSDVNYCVVGTSSYAPSAVTAAPTVCSDTLATGSARCSVTRYTDGRVDVSVVSLGIFR